MSIEGLAERAKLNNAHNVVILDIERFKGRFRTDPERTVGGLTIEGEFWDLGDYRRYGLNRRIHPDEVLEWPRNISFAWNWYHESRVNFVAEWDEGGADEMHRKAWDVYDRAQIVIGHNIDGFDTKKLRSAWSRLGLTPPSPYKSVDTLKVHRREFGDESNTLDAICKRLGIVAKTDRYDVDVARAAIAGNKAAQTRLRRYNCGDVAANKGLYDWQRPWHAGHPHSVIGTIDDRATCNSCWGDDLEPNGYTLANLILYRLFRCRACGANVKGSRHSRAAVTRGAR